MGTCAFSQLDGDNGSALYHITIGEKDAWGQGYGTEATQLMLDHAFGMLGLHRIALFVFEFNERAIRAYKRCGFVMEGRSRESIYRDGRWWDEIAMSVLESDWRRIRAEDAAWTRSGRPARRGRRRRRARHEGCGPTTRRSAARPRPGSFGARCGSSMTAPAPAADAARADVRELIVGQGPRRRQRPGRGRTAGGGVRRRLAARTPSMDLFLADLMQALEQDEGEKLGGKSAEAARFILRAIDRELDRA